MQATQEGILSAGNTRPYGGSWEKQGLGPLVVGFSVLPLFIFRVVPSI